MLNGIHSLLLLLLCTYLFVWKFFETSLFIHYFTWSLFFFLHSFLRARYRSMFVFHGVKDEKDGVTENFCMDLIFKTQVTLIHWYKFDVVSVANIFGSENYLSVSSNVFSEYYFGIDI